MWHTFLDAFGLIAQPDHSNVFAVGFSLFNMIGQVITLAGVILLSGFLSNIFGKAECIFDLPGTDSLLQPCFCGRFDKHKYDLYY